MSVPTTRSTWRKIGGLLLQRCPVCLRGRIFGGLTTMNERCPVCNLQFEREPGYFLGAMYVSYGMSIILILGLVGLLHLALANLDLGWTTLLAGALYIPFVPLTWRYSRTIWMYFDYWAVSGGS
jgi:uncharacterized protein (DUF983 family)